MEKQWWKNSAVYQIYPRSFYDSNGDGIGDLQGIIQKLDYIKSIGIDVIWLSPIYQSPNDDNGYDISDYYSIMKEFGTMQDFNELIGETHKRGLRLVMDLVVNHTSDEHAWFVESRKDKNSPYHDYYIWKKGKEDGKEPPNNWGSWFFDGAWEYEKSLDEYYLHIFSKKQVDLNWDNPNMRKDIYTMMQSWLDKGIDGFRMDVINIISKDPSFPDGEVNGLYGQYGDLTPYCQTGPNAHKYLQEMNREVLSKADIMTVGEMPSVTVEQAKQYTNKEGTELNMVFQFEHVVLDHGPYGKYNALPFSLDKFKEIMTKWQVGLHNVGWNSLYLENHDQPRMVSRVGNDSTPLFWEKSSKMLATCIYMMQGTPFIYQGQEIGMTNVNLGSIEEYKDIEALNAYKNLVEDQKIISAKEFMHSAHRLSRDNARTGMQWNAEKNGGFTTGKPWFTVNNNYKDINVAAQINDDNSIFRYYQNLLAFRKQEPIIANGDYTLLENTSPSVYAYIRDAEDEGKLLIICSFSEKETEFIVPKEFVSASVVLHNYDANIITPTIILRPYEAIVCKIS